MKTKSNVSLLFNPFERIAGAKALVIGLIFFVLSTVTSQFAGVIFDGVLGVKLIPVSITEAFLAHGISLLVLILVMYIAGLIFSPSAIRFIDIAGTMTLSRAPFLIIGLLLCIPIFGQSWSEVTSILLMPGKSLDIFYIIAFAFSMIITIVCIIWTVVLTYNAFSVSCNIKGIRNGVVFTVSLVISFILSSWLVIAVFPSKFSALIPNSSIDTADLVEKGNYETINEIAKQATFNIIDRKYDKVTPHFDNKMKEVLTDDKFAEVMKSVQERFGKIVSVEDGIKNEKLGGNRLVLVPVRFENMLLYFRFTFDDENQIIGFFM